VWLFLCYLYRSLKPIKILIPVLASLSFVSLAYAVTKSADADLSAGVGQPDSVSAEIDFTEVGESDALDQIGSQNTGGPGASSYINLEPMEDALGSQVHSGDKIDVPNRSIGIFSLALWALGLLIAFAGLFSLSLSRKIEGIAAQEFVQQVRHMSAVSIRQNVSRNWGKKKDATWFVIMGICSVVAGFIDYLFL